MNQMQQIFKDIALGANPTGCEWFDDVRREAVVAWGEMSLPTDKCEEYRRFNLKAVMDSVVGRAEGSCEGFEPLNISGDEIRIDNGRVVSEGASVLGAERAIAEYASLAKGAASAVLSTVLAADAAVIRVRRGESRKVVLDSRVAGAKGELAVSRVVVIVEEGAMLDLTDVCRTEGEVVVLRCREVFAARGANVKIADVVENPEGTVIDHRYMSQAEQTVSNVLFADVSKGASRTDYVTLLKGEHAESVCNGVFVSDLKIRDIYMDVQHLACECRSSELVKGIASEGGRGSFAGRIYVAEGAQKTDASLLNRNIVLGGAAKIYTKPTLEIYADDVKCGHGATVGQLDPEAVYYMRQRGLSKQAAERLQLLGFASEVVERFGGEAAERIAASVEQKLQTL